MLLLAIVLALGLNLAIYSCYQIKINQQLAHNQLLSAELKLSMAKIKPVADYQKKFDFLSDQINFLQKNANKREALLTFLQQINAITPAQIYFQQINWQPTRVDFIGFSRSQLYLANFLASLRVKNGIFATPVLTSNSSSDGIWSTFALAVALKPNLKVGPDEHD